MPSRPPLISVTLPNYNYGQFLAPALESILMQSYANFELLVSDDGSTDESAAIIRNYAAQDRRLKPVYNTVCPGPVHSESWQENIRQTALARGLPEAEVAAQFEREESAKIPLGQVGEGDHIASVVALLASPVSAWTTGSCIHVNGGKMAAAL